MTGGRTSGERDGAVQDAAEVHRRLVGAYGDLLAGTFEDALALIDPDVVDHRGGAEGDHVGIGPWREKWERFSAGGGVVRNTSVAVEQNVASGEFSVNRYAMRGTHATSGRSYEVTGIDMIRVRDGMVVEHWAVVDAEAMRAQLGQNDEG